MGKVASLTSARGARGSGCGCCCCCCSDSSFAFRGTRRRRRHRLACRHSWRRCRRCRRQGRRQPEAVRLGSQQEDSHRLGILGSLRRRPKHLDSPGSHPGNHLGCRQEAWRRRSRFRLGPQHHQRPGSQGSPRSQPHSCRCLPAAAQEDNLGNLLDSRDNRGSPDSRQGSRQGSHSRHSHRSQRGSQGNRMAEAASSVEDPHIQPHRNRRLPQGAVGLRPPYDRGGLRSSHPGYARATQRTGSGRSSNRHGQPPRAACLEKHSSKSSPRFHPRRSASGSPRHPTTRAKAPRQCSPSPPARP